jgi:hypothetical protein
VISLPLALVLAQIGTRLISSAMPADQVPYYITWSLDARSFLYTFAVAVATAVLFGLLPALQASRGNLVESLKDGGRGTGSRRSRLRGALVIAQVALAVVSLVAALLFVRTFSNLDTYAIGFDPKPLMTLRFYLPATSMLRPARRRDACRTSSNAWKRCPRSRRHSDRTCCRSAAGVAGTA